MAVYTDVAFEDLETLLKNYDIGSPVSFKGIAEGVENSNFHLQTDKSGYLLTLYEKRVAEKDLPYFLGLMEHLAERGLPCPVPVHDRNGQALTRLNKKPAAIVSFLPGISLRKPQAQHCHAVGVALAQMHDAVKDFNGKRPNSMGPKEWHKLADATCERADSVQAGLSNLIQNALKDIDRNWPSGLPAGVIHADLFPDNVLFQDDKVSGLIDFYFACNDAYAYDLAIMLNAWCFEPDGAFNVTKGRSLMSGYISVRALCKEEVNALPILARGSALRFLLTRLYDWLNRDPKALVRPKDPKEFSKRLRFHNRIKNAAEYGL